jgi:hypothetical protein
VQSGAILLAAEGGLKMANYDPLLITLISFVACMLIVLGRLSLTMLGITMISIGLTLVITMGNWTGEDFKKAIATTP